MMTMKWLPTMAVCVIAWLMILVAILLALQVNPPSVAP